MGSSTYLLHNAKAIGFTSTISRKEAIISSKGRRSFLGGEWQSSKEVEASTALEVGITLV